MPAGSHQIALNLLGSAFLVGTDDPVTAAEISRLWHPFLQTEAAESAQAVTVDGATTSDRLGQFATTLNATALDAAPTLAIHAGVVARHGVAIAMPASSGVGKSTLTAACIRRGFDYLSDEALCLSYQDGSVVGYPRPIALSAWSVTAVHACAVGVPVGDESLFTADDLGARNHLGAARLGHVVMLDRAGDPRSAPSLTRASRPDAVTLLLRLSFNHYRRPADAVRLAADVVRAADVWRLRYGDPLDAADLLCSKLADGPQT